MTNKPPQKIRLIGGNYKRTPLPVPLVPGLRPTSSRLRETLFNWLGQTMQGWRVLDAFAGTGALGLEAASRGAVHVTLLEQNTQLVAQLSQTVLRLGATQVEVHKTDAIKWMADFLHQPKEKYFDLILLDPPFDKNLFLPALHQATKCLSPHGLVYLESPHAWQMAHIHDNGNNDHILPTGLIIKRYACAGAVHIHLLQHETIQA